MENFKKENIMTKEKPTFLYHGSAHKNIKELEPRNKSVRDPNEGPVVFATPELALAAIFMTKKVVESGKFDDIPYAIIIDQKESFIKNNKGGHIYIVPSSSFQNDPSKGLGEYEWVSKEKVEPLQKIEYLSSLDAMIENGVQVYFIDETTHQEIKTSKDNGLSILQNIESENQKRGINLKPLTLAKK